MIYYSGIELLCPLVDMYQVRGNLEFINSAVYGYYYSSHQRSLCGK